MSLLHGGYSSSRSNGGAGSSGSSSNGSSSGGGQAGPGGGGPGDLLYQDMGTTRAMSPTAMTTHDTCGQVNDWHHHHTHTGSGLTQDSRHLQDLHSPYSLTESDSAIGLSPSPDTSLSDRLSSCSTNCMSIGSSYGSNNSSKHDDSEAMAASACHSSGAGGVYGLGPGTVGTQQQPGPPAKKVRRRGRGTRTPPRHNIDVNDNSLYAVYELFKTFLSASTASTVAIDNKIEQAMDLVKSHLMFAVREEVEVLKEKITELMERINQLEYENTVLKQYATNEALQQIQQHHNSNT